MQYVDIFTNKNKTEEHLKTIYIPINNTTLIILIFINIMSLPHVVTERANAIKLFPAHRAVETAVALLEVHAADMPARICDDCEGHAAY